MGFLVTRIMPNPLKDGINCEKTARLVFMQTHVLHVILLSLALVILPATVQ